MASVLAVLGATLCFLIYSEHCIKFSIYIIGSKGQVEAAARHVAFLKVHSTASNTVQNILMRYGWNQKLTFVLPSSGQVKSLTDDTIINETAAERVPSQEKHFDILCSYVKYSSRTFKNLLPADTKVIGIVREPFEQFVSSLAVFKPDYIFKHINSTEPIKTFLQDPYKYEPENITDSWTNNRMAFEFGFPLHLFSRYNKTDTMAYLQRLDLEFHFVIVTELLDESLIILRRVLHWDMKDILYINLHDETRLNHSFMPSFTGSYLYRNYARLDYDLYYFFFVKLRQIIRDQGVKFKEELAVYRRVREMVTRHCMANKKETLHVGHTMWSRAFSVTKDDCKNMKRTETEFLTMIGKSQLYK